MQVALASSVSMQAWLFDESSLLFKLHSHVTTSIYGHYQHEYDQPISFLLVLPRMYACVQASDNMVFEFCLNHSVSAGDAMINELNR